MPLRTNDLISRRGFSLVEMLAVVTILGLLAWIALPRIATRLHSGEQAACHVTRAEIELQAQLWKRSYGVWPATDLSDIALNTDYLTDGLPVCPVDGTTYTIDSEGHVVGHDH